MTGLSPKKIVRYYIVVDQKFMNVCINTEKNGKHEILKNFYLLQVNKNFSFSQTFDLLYKTHYAFHLSFDEHLLPLMKFMGHYFYKIPLENFTPTTRMIRIYNDVINLNES